MEWLRLKRIDKLDSFIGCQNLDRLDEYVRIIKKLKKIHDELNESHLIELNNYLEARSKVITEDNDFSKIRVKQLKNVSDKLNNRDNCFGIEKDINAQKETQSGKQVIEHLKNNAGRKGKDGALTRHVGDCLNDLINKLELLTVLIMLITLKGCQLEERQKEKKRKVSEDWRMLYLIQL
ncbi:20930_t:CDS:2 [Entrophospora sp. SA101]|nr:515_t:CDS:2 [Entrophospora sp. SA101]CAJ0755899.1 20930_t:CDS:2 [Entrophospora sp. SA101]